MKIQTLFFACIGSFIVAACAGCDLWEKPNQEVLTFDVAWASPTMAHVTSDFEPLFENHIGYFSGLGDITVVNLETGEQLWRHEEIIYSPAYAFENFLVFAVQSPNTSWSSDRLLFFTKQGEFLGTLLLPAEFYRTEALSGWGRELYLTVPGGYILVPLDPEFPESKIKNLEDWAWLYSAPWIHPKHPWKTMSAAYVADGKIFLNLGYVGMTWVDDPPWPYSLSPLHEWYTEYPSRIICLDLYTKEVLWVVEHHGMGDGTHNQKFRLLPQGLLVADGGGYLLLDPDSGEELWSAMEYGWAFNGGSGTFYTNDGLDIYQATMWYKDPEEDHLPPEFMPYTLSKFTIQLGVQPSITWGHRLQQYFGNNPLLKDGILYVLGTQGLSLWEASTGRFLGRDPNYKGSDLGGGTLNRYKDVLLVNRVGGAAALRMNFKLDAQGRLYKE